MTKHVLETDVGEIRLQSSGVDEVSIMLTDGENLIEVIVECGVALALGSLLISLANLEN